MAATLSTVCRQAFSLKMTRFLQSVLFNKPVRVRMTSTATTNGSPDANAVPKTEPETLNIDSNDKHLIEENEKLHVQITEFKDKYIRSLAETENVRQRMKKQVDDAKLFGIQGFCKDLLDVADILGTATGSVPKDQVKGNVHLKSLFEGLSMTESQLKKVFTKHNLHPITPVEGDVFDPFLHEALFQVPTTEKETGSIAVLQKSGYKLHDRTIRPALVGVFKSV